MNDLVIKNGMVVSPSGTVQTDVAIKDGKIVALGDGERLGAARRVIDAAGKYVLPGAIDAHMHVEAPFQGCRGANDFYTQSVAAAFGGVTSFMDFTNTFKGSSLVEAVEKRKEEMGKSAIDYGIHIKIVEAPETVLDEIGKVVELGCPTLKLFMTYKKEGVMADDETMVKVFRKAKEHNALAMIHAENNAIAETNIERFRTEGKLGWTDFPLSKPALCEAEAVSRAVYLSKYVGNAVLIVHTTNGEALDNARRAQQEGHPVYVETCPQFDADGRAIPRSRFGSFGDLLAAAQNGGRGGASVERNPQRQHYRNRLGRLRLFEGREIDVFGERRVRPSHSRFYEGGQRGGRHRDEASDSAF